MPRKTRTKEPFHPPQAKRRGQLILPLRLPGRHRETLLTYPSLDPRLARRLMVEGEGLHTTGITRDELEHLYELSYEIATNPEEEERGVPDQWRARPSGVLSAVINTLEDLISLSDAQERGDRAAVSKLDAEWEREKIYQFTIMLRGDFPTIWRRIQVKDCTLGKLAEFFAEAIFRCHLSGHQIEVDGQTYVEDCRFDSWGYDLRFYQGYRDESQVKIGQLVRLSPHAKEWFFSPGPFRTARHDVWFGGTTTIDRRAVYPRCVAGELDAPHGRYEDIGAHAEFMRVWRLPIEQRPSNWRCPPDYDPEKFSKERVSYALRRSSVGYSRWRMASGQYRRR
ncbi:Plasmid pRiA4b ORF-3-like protein [Pirellulimonas nuda]|uniref:Plasmid pRiA4b ORF-3-like protein n=1 Tax=Pirellulimonas nuda TaxID=2528009 RepID=A0A518DHK8_9BACT|nr:plasmid pRiA4b ORF-3 family protein [Pirellulimonas nuda]QDU90958.1 Plasmid pRiA4b ORF-3-like protein [Pirellulimonas nuda]